MKHQREQQGPRGRILRIGVILGGKIVEEKLVRERTDVTIGQSAKNMFCIPVEGLPRTWQLFVMHNGRYFLRFSESMDGRLSDGGEVFTLDALKGRQAQQRGDAWVVPLSDQGRGKIILGEMTLLFQFVAEPPMQPRPHLPASVRGTLADRVDPHLAIIMAISILLHFSIALFAYQRDREVKTRTTRIFNETFQRPTVAPVDLQLEQPELEDTKAEEEAAKEEKEETKEESKDKGKTEKKPKPAGDPGKKAGPSAEERKRMEEEARRMVAVMTGGMESSGIGSDASGRDPKSDLDAAIDEIKSGNAKVEIGSGSGRGTRDEGTTEIGTGQGPDVTGPGESTQKTETKTKEKIPQGRVKLGGGSSDDETTLSPEGVMRKIQSAYMSGLKRCHKDLLKRDPSAGGRVALKFMVGERGTVVRVKATGFDPGVDKCIEARAKSWRFGVPKDEDGDPTDATFKISLVLQAD